VVVSVPAPGGWPFVVESRAPSPSICPLSRHLVEGEDCAPEWTFCSRPAEAARTGGLTEAAAQHLRNELLGAALDAWEAEDGPFSDSELNAAAAALSRTRRGAA
jgi:hypothetical protein